MAGFGGRWKTNSIDSSWIHSRSSSLCTLLSWCLGVTQLKKYLQVNFHKSSQKEKKTIFYFLILVLYFQRNKAWSSFLERKIAMKFVFLVCFVCLFVFTKWPVICDTFSVQFDLLYGEYPWRRKWQPTPVFLPGESHGERSLAGYSPWGPTALDTT